MKYDGFQRVAQRFEVLWPESIRYATSALQERLSAACFSSNNHPHCPLTCSVELKGNCQNNTGRKKKNHWKCTADRCGCSSRGKCGNVVLRDFPFFYVLRWIRFGRFCSVCCCFPLLMWWIELTMKGPRYCHKNCSMVFLWKRISKASSFLLRSDWNSWGRNLPQLCLFMVFLVLFRTPNVWLGWI